MSNFDDFLTLLKSQLRNIAQDAGQDIADELLKDGTAFVQKTQDDLKRWTVLLAKGELTQDEFAYLLEAKKDLAEMEALKQKGLAEIRIDELKNAVFNTILGSAITTFV